MIRTMLPRVQRIGAGIELFALVFWVGGLFFIFAFVEPVVTHAIPDDPDSAWRIVIALITHFGSVELIFAVAVLVSNFLKVIVFRGMSRLERVALMVSAIMLIFACTGMFILRPRLHEQRAQLTTLAPDPTAEPSPARQEFEALRHQQEALFGINWALGLFLVYAYRNFEERKLQALARIIKMP